MSNVIQSVIASLIVATILGILAYALIIRENQIYISVLSEKVTKAEEKLEKNNNSIQELKLLIAQVFPKRQVFSISSNGAREKSEVPPIETAVIFSGANLAKELAEYASQESDKPSEELIKSKEEYETLLKLAKQDNPNIEMDLEKFKKANIDTVKTDPDLTKAHSVINDITRGLGESNDLVRAREKILASDKGEAAKIIRDPKALLPWAW